VIFAGATPALVALSRETNTLPIVFVQVSDPVKLGYVPNLPHPGGNITGFANFEHSIGGKWLQLLQDTAPGTNPVAIMFESETPSTAPYLDAIKTAAPSFGLQLTLVDVRNSADIERAIAALAQQAKGALIVVPSRIVIANCNLIISLVAQYRLPAVYPYRLFTSSGGLLSYGVDLSNLYRRAATYVDLILKGTKPGDLPVQLPTKFELVINLKTAKALGLTIPRSLLATADEVIE
jgi:putative tryptophan/tyrosine transport system substrate-binding protein